MKNIKAALAGITLAALSGCSSDIDTVREGRLQNLPEYTVSQALDNREICQDTDWSTLKDEKGRNIVRYKCEMKGIEEWYHDLAQNLINGEFTNSDISSTRDKVESLKSQLAKLEGEKEEFVNLSKKLSANGNLTTSEKNRRTWIFQTNWKRSNSITSLRKEIPPLENHLDQKIREAAKNKDTGEYILNNYKGSSAYETIDWLVIEDGSFMPIGGSLYEIQPGDSDFSEIPTPDIEAAIYAIYEADVESYFDYKQAIGIPL
tara:strand:+ start:139 stop:921 length:783 start_codon:yes stop_codon:yes gene_type:complete